MVVLGGGGAFFMSEVPLYCSEGMKAREVEARALVIRIKVPSLMDLNPPTP